MVHDYCTFLVIDFGVDAGVADEVYNPFLAFVLGEAQAGREVSGDWRLVLGIGLSVQMWLGGEEWVVKYILNIYPLMNLTVRL